MEHIKQNGELTILQDFVNEDPAPLFLREASQKLCLTLGMVGSQSTPDLLVHQILRIDLNDLSLDLLFDVF